MTKEQYKTLDRIHTYINSAIWELEVLGKLERVKNNLEFDLNEIEVYIKMMMESDYD